jgi:short-subunit dehydrogenase
MALNFSHVISLYYIVGKTVVVTGGSSGIGLEIAKLLSSFGANIIISARNKEKLIEVAALCQIINPKTMVFPIEIDLEKYQNIDDYTTQIIDTLEKNGLSSKIDVLINSAGVSSRGLAMDTNMETLERIMVSLHTILHRNLHILYMDTHYMFVHNQFDFYSVLCKLISSTTWSV